MRVLIHVDPEAAESTITGAATELGATIVRPPRPELPDVVLAVFDDRPAAQRSELLARLGEVRGVRAVELDSTRTTEG